MNENRTHTYHTHDFSSLKPLFLSGLNSTILTVFDTI